MERLIMFCVLAIVAGAARADLVAPVRALATISDPSMVVTDRGSQLEVFPTKRAVLQSDQSGRAAIHSVMATTASAPIGAQQLGVVFNHAMQQQGYISGEIAFMMKAGLKLSGVSSSQYPGLKKITNPEVYVVNTRTPAEFMAVLKRLQARGDLEWVEPTVTYGPSKTSGSIQ
jgi:hypothetical protein